MLALHRSLRPALAALSISLSPSAAAQTNPADHCNTVNVSPFPAAADQAQTVHVRRYCPEAGVHLADLQIERDGQSIRIGTRCSATPLPLFSCQV